jgi:hypothetical protein
VTTGRAIRTVARCAAALVLTSAFASLVSCGSGAPPHATPRPVTPTDLGRTAGLAPKVLDRHTPTVATDDRVVAIGDVTTGGGPEPGTTVVGVAVTVTASTDLAVANRSSFFQVIGHTGDVFAPRNPPTDPFFTDIEAHTSREGTLEFAVPQAASSGLQLLYRPEDPTDAAVVLLDHR